MKSQQDIWSKIAKEWAEFRTQISPAVRDFLKNKKGRILDLGCGSGRNFIKRKDLKFYCVDFSSEMLRYARKRADKLEIKAEFIESDSCCLNFPNNYFDSVICISLLHCIKGNKRLKIINELFRVLKPTGQVFISVWSRNSPRLKNKPKECMIPWTMGINKEKRYTYIYEKDELEKEVKKAGFKILKSWEERNINIIAEKQSS